MVVRAIRLGCVRNPSGVLFPARRIMGRPVLLNDGNEDIVMIVLAMDRGLFVRMEGMHVPRVHTEHSITTRTQGTHCVGIANHLPNVVTSRVLVVQNSIFRTIGRL